MRVEPFVHPKFQLTNLRRGNVKYLPGKTDALSGADNHDRETHMIVISLLQKLRNEMAEDETLEMLKQAQGSI